MTSITWFFFGLFLSVYHATLPLAHHSNYPLNCCARCIPKSETHVCVVLLFQLSLSLNRGQTLIKTVLIYNSMRRIIVRRCHFWKFLTEGVCTYNVIKYYFWSNVIEINTDTCMLFYWGNFISNTTLIKYNIVQNFDPSALTFKKWCADY